MTITYLAYAYNSGAYGAGAYETGSNTAANGSGGSILTNTGFDIAVIVTLACVITFTALVVRLWKRPGHNLSTDTSSDT